ncbi:MAG: hypothetical protein HFH68_12545, partial [Lachnospiraceae bacterium]|nr:hypothetical protein [Lachnospiraceae bacterium]
MVKLKQVLKKPFCITLCSAMVITSGNFTVPGMAGTVKVSAEETEGQNKNLIDNPSFEGVGDNGDGSKNIYWWHRTGESAVLDIIDDGKGHTGKYVKLSGRTQTWEAVRQDVFHDGGTQPEDIENHTEYEFSCFVKLDESC